MIPSCSASDQPDSSHLPPDHWGSDITWFRGEVSARDRQLRHDPAGGLLEHGVDGSDLRKLEKRVEELQLKFLRLEEKQANVSTGSGAAPSAGLQAEVMWLKKGLEDHLRVFKNVFRNAEVLAGSEATLELDKLWQLLKKQEKKKKAGGGAKQRSKRYFLGECEVRTPGLISFMLKKVFLKLLSNLINPLVSLWPSFITMTNQKMTPCCLWPRLL